MVNLNITLRTNTDITAKAAHGSAQRLLSLWEKIAMFIYANEMIKTRLKAGTSV